MENLFIIIPAYNEENTIKQVIKEWHSIVKKIGNNSRLVIICDGSKDNTPQIVRNSQGEMPFLDVLEKENSGHGSTCLYGYKYAIEQNASFIFQTDSDGQTVPDEFWKFWNKRFEYDAHIGIRSERQDGFSRKIVTNVLKLVIFLSFGLWIKDANTPFRLVKRDWLQKFLEFAPQNFFLSNVLMSIFLVKFKANINWEQITFKPRQGGVNSINIKRIIKIGIESIVAFNKQRKRFINNVKN